MAQEKEIISAYKELKGVMSSIENQDSWFNDEGFTQHANLVIDRVGSVCAEIQDIAAYRLNRDVLRDGRAIVHTVQAKQKLKSLLGRMEGLYELGESEQAGKSGHTFIQNQSQTQSQYLSVVLDMQERILTELPKHAEGTKERTFLETLKETLPTVKNFTDILSSALKIGGDLGLDPGTIHGLLGL